MLRTSDILEVISEFRIDQTLKQQLDQGSGACQITFLSHFGSPLLGTRPLKNMIMTVGFWRFRFSSFRGLKKRSKVLKFPDQSRGGYWIVLHGLSISRPTWPNGGDCKGATAANLQWLKRDEKENTETDNKIVSPNRNFDIGRTHSRNPANIRQIIRQSSHNHPKPIPQYSENRPKIVPTLF